MPLEVHLADGSVRRYGPVEGPNLRVIYRATLLPDGGLVVEQIHQSLPAGEAEWWTARARVYERFDPGDWHLKAGDGAIAD